MEVEVNKLTTCKIDPIINSWRDESPDFVHYTSRSTLPVGKTVEHKKIT